MLHAPLRPVAASSRGRRSAAAGVAIAMITGLISFGGSPAATSAPAQVSAPVPTLATTVATTAAPAQADPRRLTVSTSSPVPGDRVRFSGKAAKPGKRQVRLQVRRDGVWRTTAKASTRRSGTFAFSHRVRVDGRYRVLAPAVKKSVKRADGTRRVVRTRAWTSRSAVVRPRLLSTTLTWHGATTVRVDAARQWSLAARPAAPQRRVAVHLLTPNGWREVAHVRTSGTGAVRIPAFALGVGSHQVRLVAAATPRTAAAVVTQRLTVLPAPEPTPEPTPTPTPEPTPEPTTTPTPTPEPLLRDTAQGLHLRGDLPVVSVTAPEPVTSKTEYVRSQMTIDAAGTTAADGTSLPSHELDLRLRVRGNSTSWVQTKLPYKVKLDDRTSLLGMPESKDFVLLANFYDRSLMRNTAAFEAARRIGVPWSPRMVDVDLYLNGVYKGVYQLGEGIEVEPGRVDLGADELPETPDNGGFLIEADHWDDTDPKFTTAKGIQFYLKEFGSESDEYREALTAQMQAFEDALYSDDFLDDELGYRRLVDLRSFADWYLLHELTKSTEANFGTSVWMQRAVGGRLAMGPPWDFDQSAGVRRVFGVTDPEGWFVHAGPLKPGVSRAAGMVKDGPHWIQRMLEDPQFRLLVAERWQAASPSLHAMVDQLDVHADRIAASALSNFAPLDEGGAAHWLTHSMLDEEDMVLHHPDWRGHADDVTSWYAGRITWLDRAIPTLGGDQLP